MIKRNKTIAKIMALAACISIISCTSSFAAETVTTDASVSINTENTAQDGYYTFDPSTGAILDYYKYSCDMDSNDSYINFDPSTGTILEANIIKPDGMTNVIIPDTIKGVTVTNIGDYAFSTFANQTSIREVKLPTTIKNIGECAFANCSTLLRVNIPKGVTKIRNNTFLCCSNLSIVVLPTTIQSIDEWAFANCSNLRKLVINSENLSNIGEYAFYKCSKLSEVTLPDSLKTIDNHAFGYCTKLTSIDVPDGINTVSRNSFEHISEYALFNVSSVESKDVLIKAGILEDKINYTAE